MATKRRTTRRPATPRRRTSNVPSFSVSPEVARSLFGLTLLVLGVITLIMIFLPASQGSLTEWAQRTVNPLFGSGRWLLPFLLMAAGAYVEWGGPPAAGWQWRFVAAAIAYIAFLGLLEFLPVRGGGRIGTTMASILRHWVGNDVAVFVLLAGLMAAGIVIALQKPFRTFIDPIVGAFRTTKANVTAPRAAAERPLKEARSGDGRRAIAPSRLEDGRATAAATSILDEPAPRGGQPPMSQTVWVGTGEAGATRAASGAGA
ncbi:MAG TPA: hypothetical protein VFP22_07050, partial [Candidatus Limnocylindrales bacterium]|nr:hypothetical protein [Candidatus Limnocylindrales bacterium]